MTKEFTELLDPWDVVVFWVAGHWIRMLFRLLSTKAIHSMIKLEQLCIYYLCLLIYFEFNIKETLCNLGRFYLRDENERTTEKLPIKSKDMY